MLFPDKMLRARIAIDTDNVDEVLERIGETGVLHIDTRHMEHDNALEESRVHTLLAQAQKQMKQLGIPPAGHAVLHAAHVETLLHRYEERLQASGETIDAWQTARSQVGREAERFKKANVLKAALAPRIDLEALAEGLRRIGMRVAAVETVSAELLRMVLAEKEVLVVEAPLYAQTSAVALFFDPRRETEIVNALAAFKARDVDRRYFVSAAFDALRKQQEALEQRKAVLTETHAAMLQETEGVLRDLVALESAKAALTEHRGKWWLEGWVPKQEADRFAAAVPAAEVKMLRAEADAPVRLYTPRMFRAFETLVGTFSCPRYGEINPVLPFAVTFLALFGIMFGDVGHGLVLALGGWLFGRRKPSHADLGHVFFLSGLSAAFFGLLYGSVFGVHDLMPHLLFTPIENISATIAFSIGIGVVMISVSFLLNLLTAIKRKEPAKLFASEGSLLWLLVYWFTIGIFVKSVVQQLDITYEATFLGLLLLAIFIQMWRAKREKSSVFIDLIRAFADILTNTISFVRVGAFALAHGALFMAVFSIARLISESHGPSFFYWMEIIVGNLVIIVLEGVVVTIQTLRLEYYEFFKRFFKGGGTPYHPYRIGGDDVK